MGSSGKDAVRDAKNAANNQMAQMKMEQGKAKAAVEKQKKAYKSFEFENVYDNMSMENFAEDLTVNQQQAQFQAQQGAQQRSNIMQDLRGAAGGSGIAGLAQAMAGQGQLAAQQQSASIGQQESANQASKVVGAQDVQRRREVQMGGDAAVQQAESGREATLLGMEYGGLQAAQAGVQGAYGAQQSAMAMELERVNANKALTGQIIGAGIGAAATVGAAFIPKPVCFAEGDKVEMFDGIMKAIELIKIGDEVKSIKDNKVVKGIVTNTLIHSTNDVVEVVKINGITAEPKHPVFVDNKWILIGELQTTTYQFIDNWYNLEVDGNIGDSEHNYIIGGLTASGLGDNIELNNKYQRQPKQLTQHLDIEFKQI